MFVELNSFLSQRHQKRISDTFNQFILRSEYSTFKSAVAHKWLLKVPQSKLEGCKNPSGLYTLGWSDGFPIRRWVSWALWGEMSLREFVNCELKTLILHHISSFFRVPWTARSSNQSILKEINPEYSLEDWCWTWSSSTLATLWEELAHWRRPWCQERLRGRRRRGLQRMRWLEGITDSMDTSLS